MRISHLPPPTYVYRRQFGPNSFSGPICPEMDSTVGVFRHPILKEFQHVRPLVSPDRLYARQQANADQQYEEWVQNCESLRHAVLFYRGEHQHEVAQELQERLAVLERNPPDPATAVPVALARMVLLLASKKK